MLSQARAKSVPESDLTPLRGSVSLSPRLLEEFGAYRESSCVLTGASEAEEDPCEVITSNLFPLLGVAPYRGRTFTPEEDTTLAFHGSMAKEKAQKKAEKTHFETHSQVA
jgi:hypothetical protein